MSDQTALPNMGKYEMLEKIGEGGFGIVYRGRDPMLERDVAIKVLKSDVATSPDFVARFRREARMAASLRHPNIATVIEVGEHDGRYFMVMDYLSGGPLSHQLQEAKPLPLTQAVEWLRPIASALDHAHSKGIIHRDVKPSNILLNEDGQPVLSDFGLVKSLVDDSLTTSGVTLGTKKYMAPEQIQGQSPSPAIDVYALGIVAYEILTGQVPFDGTSFEIQKGHVELQPPDPRTLNAELPPEIAACLLRALSKNPVERYPSPGQFVGDLQATLEQMLEKEWKHLLEKAQQHMRRFEFDAAITALAKAHALKQTEHSQELLRECQHRKMIWAEYQDLHQQASQIDIRLKNLRQSETWLPGGARRPASRLVKTLRIFRLLSASLLVLFLLYTFAAIYEIVPAPSWIVQEVVLSKYLTGKFIQRQIAIPGIVISALLFISFSLTWLYPYIVSKRQDQ